MATGAGGTALALAPMVSRVVGVDFTLVMGQEFKGLMKLKRRMVMVARKS